jgi:alcohol dehydrogenase class IV
MEQQFFLGVSSIKDFLSVLQKYAPRHIFLVRGKKSYEKCGANAIMDNVLNILHCNVTEFYDFEENPKIEDLERGLFLLRQSQSSIIVAIGGGSVLDMSKLLRFFYSYSGTTGKEFKKEYELLPLITLPTTAGTGSEATHFAVLYKNKVKYSIEHDDILSDVAIVYPPFTYNNPKYLTACTGFDALAQGIEAYWNVNATEESDGYAEKAIILLWPNLPLAVNSPTNEIRDIVSEGSYWAGRAINITKTTAPHAFSYPFTTYYGYPHGHAVAFTFSLFFNIYINRAKSNKARILKDILYKDMSEYIESIGLNLSLERTIDIYEIVNKSNVDRMRNYPLTFEKEEVFEYLKSIVYEDKKNK